MRSYYEQERQRSREKSSGGVREGQGDEYRPSFHQLGKKKRVKFDDQEDIRVFRRQDEPAAKPLSENEIVQAKNKLQNQINTMYDFNWDEKKHLDAKSEQNSIKQQKQKEKQLYEKLMSMKEEIQFYPPSLVQIPQEILPPVCESKEKKLHEERIKDQLGCYYTQLSQIPNQPIFQLIPASAKAEPRPIKFQKSGINDGENFALSKNKEQKQLKGILKIPGEPAKTSASRQSEAREISPRLIWLLKDMQSNKQKYNKQMTEMLLRPYKESGELSYLMSNQALLNQLLKNQPLGTQPPPSNSEPRGMPYMGGVMPPYSQSVSPSRGMEPRGNYPGDPNGAMKTDKYKTVPCKYFHSPQGCVKTEHCTFIHDQNYRGQPHPLMNKQSFQAQGYQGNYQSRPNFASGYQQAYQQGQSMQYNPNERNPNYYSQSQGGYPPDFRQRGPQGYGSTPHMQSTERDRQHYGGYGQSYQGYQQSRSDREQQGRRHQ